MGKPKVQPAPLHRNQEARNAFTAKFFPGAVKVKAKGGPDREVGTKQAAQAQPYVPGAISVTCTLQHTCP